MPDGDAIRILRALAGEAFRIDAEAKAFLFDCAAREVEPLRTLAAQLGIGEAEIYARAAGIAGLAFSPAIPESTAIDDQPVQIDTLGSIRSVRGHLLDREILFVAAGLNSLAELEARLTRNPALAHQVCIVPPAAVRDALHRQFSPALRGSALDRLARKWPWATAHLDLGNRLRLSLVLAAALLAIFAVYTPELLLPVLAPVFATIFLIPALLRLIAALFGLALPQRETLALLDDDDLPGYTVLVPLRDEAEIVPQLVAAMGAIDYPDDKLDVAFVVEDTSTATINALRSRIGAVRFSLHIVPDGLPRTKPKAVNYCLPFVTGEHVVIFDAEDIPERDQLRLAAAKFAAHPELDCLQAELVVDNADENWLTMLFTAEYAAQFGLVLPTLARYNLPMPLGGTSNHFRTRALLEVGGWDSFNVTEDADLGIRLSRLGHRTATLASMTYEEAPISVVGWVRQRTRWTKGWTQTFLVHNRHPWRLLRNWGLRRFLMFEAYVGGMVLAGPTYLLFLISLTIQMVMDGGIRIGPTPTWQLLFGSVFALGLLSNALTGVLGLIRFGRGRLAWSLILLPVYWVLNSVAAFRALMQLVRSPYVWEKTRHAQTRLSRKGGVPKSRHKTPTSGIFGTKAPRLPGRVKKR